MNYTAAKTGLLNERSDFDFRGIVEAMSTCEAVLDLILHLHKTNALKNKDKTLEFNIQSAKESCQQNKKSPEGLKVFVTRIKELQKLQGLLVEIYLSCKADIDHKKIKYLKEDRPFRCSIQ
ncbi:MAG: hypothetical protein P4M14_01060 [Gammaproteobacteria bacterium]|nr:hypothetical protein [Gammaproteobacteria bacterium]